LVGRTLLKSAPAKVTQGRPVLHRRRCRGAPISRVEVQVDGGPWRQATIDRSDAGKYTWTFW
jgi:hypothetical protein